MPPESWPEWQIDPRLSFLTENGPADEIAQIFIELCESPDWETAWQNPQGSAHIIFFGSDCDVDWIKIMEGNYGILGDREKGKVVTILKWDTTREMSLAYLQWLARKNPIYEFHEEVWAEIDGRELESGYSIRNEKLRIGVFQQGDQFNFIAERLSN